MKRVKTVGVIGAGIAGLTCAQTLHSSDVEVTVLEKSRGVGGRVATRRLDSGVTFDHGAQYFTVRDAVFGAQVKQCCAGGTAALWQGRIVNLNQGVVTDLTESRDRYVGVTGMNAIAKSLAMGLNVQSNVTARSIRQLEGKWQLEDAAGKLHGLRAASGIAHANRSPPSSNQGAGLEVLQAQCLVIKLPTGLRVSGLQDLKSTV